MKHRDVNTLVKWLIVATAVVAGGLVLWHVVGGPEWWELLTDRGRVRQAVEEFGPMAPVVYVSLLVLQAVLAPLPAPAVAAAGGYTFGAFWGFVLTWVGVLIGGALCFGVSRLFGREYVTRNERLEGLDRRVEEHGAIIVFVLRLIPLVSFDAISYAAGLTGISFWKFFLATALGSAPGAFVFVYLGGALPGPGLYAALGGLAVLALAAYMYHRRVGGKRGKV
ncbi:MAG: TVP38/TMEM64 family protein [Rubrobacteraceae bacterium]